MIGLAALWFAVATATAAAEPDPPDPPSIGVNYTDAMRAAYSGRRALEVVHQSARCIVRRARTASENLISAVPNTNAEARIMYGPIASRLDQCAAMGVYVSNMVLRGAIAEALYELSFPSPPLTSAATVEPIQWSAGNSSAATLAPIYELGRCVVAGNAPLVRRLLETEPFSQSERDALRELRPRLDPCLDRGRTYNINRESLRAILAESHYRSASVRPAAQ